MNIVTIIARQFSTNGNTKEIGRISTYGKYEEVRVRLRNKIIERYPKLHFFTIREYKS